MTIDLLLLRNIVLLVVSGLTLGVGVMILLNNLKSKINIFFSLSNLCLGTWVFLVFLAHGSSNLDNLDFYFRIKMFVGVLIVYFLYIFSIYFPVQQKKFGVVKYLVLMIYPVWMLIAMAFAPNSAIGSAEYRASGNLFIVNKIFWTIDSIFFSYYLIGTVVRLWMKYKKSTGFAKTQIGYVMVAVISAGSGGEFFNIVIPFWDNFKIEWIGALFSFPVFFIISYFLFFRNLKYGNS